MGRAPSRVDRYVASQLIAALITTICLATSSWAAGERQPAAQPGTITVGLDGSGDYRSIQEAVDAAGAGDTIIIKSGSYQEDVTIHSKDRLRLVGTGVDQVKILGRDRVGAFHIGKWPYGATRIEISDVTIHEHGGLAMGMFNGRGVILNNVHIAGLLFGQQVEDVRIERCAIGGSETTGVQFADSQAILVGNLIYGNDHGVTITGKSDVRLEYNVIRNNLYEGVVISDEARAVLVNNTIVKNGGGLAFLGASRSEVAGNIVGLNKVGFLVGPSSDARFSHNAVHNDEEDYVRAGTPNVPAPEMRAATDIGGEPGFVDSKLDDFRLRPDSALVGVGRYPYLGALPPLDSR